MAIETVVMGESGRIVLPASIRKELGLRAGQKLTISSNSGSIRIRTMQMALDEIRESIVKEHGTLNGILDDFLADRVKEREAESAE